VGEQQFLFVMVNSDGVIYRVGTGKDDTSQERMQVGLVGPELFDCLAAKITPQLLNWFGRGVARDPALKGTLCKLKVGFKRKVGEDIFTYWHYGTQSSGPPPEVQAFVQAAVDATSQWYETCKHNNRRND